LKLIAEENGPKASKDGTDEKVKAKDALEKDKENISPD
jgi:hypothetical protein